MFLIVFVVKVLMFLVYIWLFDVYVEVLIVGLVILVVIVLKIGGYGFLCFNLLIVLDVL